MYSLKSKWCIKFLDLLKQSVSSQDSNPPTSALSLESCPTQQHKGIAPALPPHPAHQLPTLCHWAGKRTKNHLEKHPGQVLSSIQINAAMKAIYWGEAEPADLAGVHSGSTLLRVLPHAGTEAPLGPTDLGLRREGSTGR